MSSSSSTDDVMNSEIRRLRERLAANGVAHSPSYTQSPLHKRGRRSDSPLFSQVDQTGFVLSAPPPPSSLANQLPHGAGNGGATDAPHVEETVVHSEEDVGGDLLAEAVTGTEILIDPNLEFSGISDDPIESFSSDDRNGGSRRHVWLSEDSEEDMAVDLGLETAGRSNMTRKGTPYPPTTSTTSQAAPKAQRRANGSSKRRARPSGAQYSITPARSPNFRPSVATSTTCSNLSPPAAPRGTSTSPTCNCWAGASMSSHTRRFRPSSHVSPPSSHCSRRSYSDGTFRRTQPSI